jgi:hypothetical protein
MAEGDEDREGGSRNSALIGFVVILMLAVGAILLVRELGQASKMQDCLMSGRTNCAPINAPARQ